MKKAVRNLLTTPQNNLKIFKNGQLVYSDELKGNEYKILKEWLEPGENGKATDHKRLLDKWCSLVTDALLSELTEEPPYNLSDSGIEVSDLKMDQSPLKGQIRPCNWSSDRLPANCILHRILSLQKLQNVPFLQLFQIYRQKKSIEGDYNYVKRLLDSSDEMGPVERYLLSTTAKDCSIFIAFHQTKFKTTDSLQFVQDCDGRLYKINIGISDIDPKPLSCIEKHFKRDQDIVDTILYYINTTRKVEDYIGRQS